LGCFSTLKDAAHVFAEFLTGDFKSIHNCIRVGRVDNYRSTLRHIEGYGISLSDDLNRREFQRVPDP
jgi:hypothetical protein